MAKTYQPHTAEQRGLFDEDGQAYDLIGFDCESHLVQQGRTVPRMVCLSLAGLGQVPEWVRAYEGTHGLVRQHTQTWSALFNRAQAVDLTRIMFRNPRHRLIAHNAAFDLCTLADASLVVPPPPVQTATDWDPDPKSRNLLCGRNPGIWDVSWGIFRRESWPEVAPEWDPTGDLCALVLDTAIREAKVMIAEGTYKYHPILGKRSSSSGGDDAGWIPSLADCVKIHFGVDISADKKDPDAWRLRYRELDGVPVTEWPEDAVDYAIEDAEWALRVAVAQSTPRVCHETDAILVREDGSVVNEGDHTRANLALTLMAAWGPRTDRDLVEGFKATVDAAVAAAEQAGLDAGFLRVDKGKVKRTMETLYQRVEAAYEGRHQDAPEGSIYTGTYTREKKDGTPGRPRVKTDAQTLKQSGDPALEAWGGVSDQRTFQTRYLPQLVLGLDYAMTSRPNALVTSLRESWTKPNQHNPPRKGQYRECHLAREGMVYLAVDYPQVELRTFAQTCWDWFGHSDMREAFIRGDHPHAMLAAELQGVALVDFDKHTEDGALNYQGAKVANFGFLGGLGAPTFVFYAKNQGLDLNHLARPGEDALDVSKRIKTAFLNSWSETGQFFALMSRLNSIGRFALQIPRVGSVRGDLDFKSGSNTCFQSPAAVALKRAHNAVSRECYVERGSPLYGVRPWLALHDELIVEGPEATVNAWAPRVGQIMRSELQLMIPDVPVPELELAVSRRWYKGAKEVRDENGALVPWEPSE